LLADFLKQNLAAALAEVERRAWETDDGAVEASLEQVRRLRELRRALAAMAKDQVEASHDPTYLVAASFLRDAFRTLTKTHDEALVYATGPEDGKRLFALTRLVTFELAKSSAAYASPDPASQSDALAQLDADGERLLATIHSHPGSGARATTPSCVDLATQETLERYGYPTIGVVCSRDGYVRFYVVNRPFRVFVSGAGVERVEERLYRLTDTTPRSLFRRRNP